MYKENRVLIRNLGMLLLYSIFLHLFFWVNDLEPIALMIFMAIAIAFHIFMCLLFAIGKSLTGNKKMALQYLLAAGRVLVIGFSACLAGAAIYTK